MGKGKKEEKKKEVRVRPLKDNTAKIAKKAAKIAQRAQLRKDMEDQCCKKLRVKKHELQKLVGTPNINRLGDILNDVYLDSTWFKARNHESKYSKEPLAPAETPAVNEGRSSGNVSMDSKPG